MTINELIAALNEAKRDSHNDGSARVKVCIGRDAKLRDVEAVVIQNGDYVSIETH